LFSEQASELGISEMARMTKLHKSTLAGLVYTLERNGYLVQNPDTRKYRLGLVLAERAGVALRQYGVNRVAESHLKALAERCQEAVNLGMIEGDMVVYIDHIDSTRNLIIRTKIGKRSYIHVTALGKAMIATWPEQALLALLDRLTLVPFTSNTITTRDGMLEEIALTRQRGYSLDNEEFEIGGRCVGAAIYVWRGQAVAAVSLSAPIQRFPAEQIPSYSAAVVATANAISRDLGFQPSVRLGG
jgi:DNA-binding IclR family transcriptional regulator